MLRTNFNLRTHQSKKPVPIVLRLRWAGYDIKYSTHLATAPKNWDLDRQRVRKTNLEPLHGLINKALDTLQRQAQKVYLEMVANGIEPLPNELREGLDFETQRKRIVSVDFWKFYDDFINNSENRINPNTGKKISIRTIQRYITTYKILKEYEKESGTALTFSSLDFPTLKDFLEWLSISKEYRKNTVAKHWETLKSILINATNEKLNVNLDFKNPTLKAGREQPDTIYLNDIELQKISNLDLSQNLKLEKVRDLFLIASYTGLRFSDFTAIEPHHIGKDFLTIKQFKTGQSVSIPIHPTVRNLFKKYNQQRNIKTISNQKFNEYIKEVCRLAGITEIVETQTTKGGKVVKETIPKFLLVSSHTGRRTLATNLYKKGVPIQSIMAITGHRTEKAFRTYIRLSNIEHAEIIKNVWND